MGQQAEEGVVGVVITLLTSAAVLLNILLILLCALVMVEIKRRIDNKGDERVNRNDYNERIRPCEWGAHGGEGWDWKRKMQKEDAELKMRDKEERIDRR